MYDFLKPILRMWLRRRSPEMPLFDFSYVEWARSFKAAGETAGLGCLGPPTLHQLRHGGVSTDAAANTKDLAAIQQQGRWADQRSLRRYAKGGRVTQQMWALPDAVRKRALRETRAIGATLSKTCPPM